MNESVAEDGEERFEVEFEIGEDGDWHEPTIQLMAYQEGEAAGSFSVPFRSYNHCGGFQRSR